MNMFKKNGGFTLVELIVVIAILAILAGVAIPAYSGYINKANETADITELAAVKTACTAALATEGEVTGIEVSGTAIKVTYKTTAGATETIDNIAAATTVGKDFADFYGTSAPTLKSGTKAVWNEADGWVISTPTA